MKTFKKIAWGFFICSMSLLIVAIIVAISLKDDTSTVETPVAPESVSPIIEEFTQPAEIEKARVYVANVETISALCGEAFQELGSLLIEYIPDYDNEWAASVSEQILIIKGLAEDVRELDPPESMKSIHIQFSLGIYDLDMARYLLARGLNTKNADLLDEANECMEVGYGHIVETTRLMNEFRNEYLLKQ